MGAWIAQRIEHCLNGVAVKWSAADRNVRRRYAWGFMAIVLLFVTVLHPAQSNAFTGLNALEKTYTSLGSSWMKASLHLALGISGIVLTAVFVYRFAKMIAAARGNLAVVMPSLPMLFAELYLPLFIVGLLPTIMGDLFAFAKEIGAHIGVTTTWTPDAIMGQGITLGFGAFQNIVTGFIHGSTQVPPDTCSGAFYFSCEAARWAEIGVQAAAAANSLGEVISIAGGMCLVIMFVFAMLAAELLLATVEIAITLPLGAWTAGFLGTPAQGMAGNTLGAAAGAIIRYLVVFALVAAAAATAAAMTAPLGAALAIPTPTSFGAAVGDLTGFNMGWLRPLVSVAAGCLVLLKVTKEAGKLADGVMSGRGVLSGAGTVHGGVSGVGSAVGGTAMGGLTGGWSGAAAGAATGVRGAAQSTLTRMRD